ncbi:hypothetical protein PIROE2DRAFT_68801 [Piromyces sp. E2]|nr:hypothetical protein PIROE2DRAFT_68801 [Piromyces sp. E2]|eukprot:OUM67664.1 hypothetical protein PIROE2DRAFT_68801 [Piromyces sp. E2]
MITKSKENIVVVDDKNKYEDFDGDDTMENMLDLFIFHRKDAVFLDWVSFLSFLMFLSINVGCVSYNLTKAIKQIKEDSKSSDINIGTNQKSLLNTILYGRALPNITDILHSSNSTQNAIIVDGATKVLYITEFSVIMLFLLIALYNYLRLMFNPSSKAFLSNAANFTRLVREFSCFTLVPLFNIGTIMGIYRDIAVTFEEERKKYSDRSKLWDGIWGVGTKDVQKTSAGVDLGVEGSIDALNAEPTENHTDNTGEGIFKRIKRSKIFLRLVSIIIYIGFLLSLLAVIGLAVFAFVALYIKTRHVGKFISRTTSDGFDVYKWINFITFIMNIASLSQQSPAIKLIIYQLKILTKKAHYNEYRRKKQNRIKENATKFDADKDQEGIQPPKIIIHRKRISRTQDDTNIEKLRNDENEIQDIDTDRLLPNKIKRQNSKLSVHSTNSV